MGLLHWYIGRKEVEARWGDLHSGLLFERTRQEPAAAGRRAVPPQELAADHPGPQRRRLGPAAPGRLRPLVHVGPRHPDAGAGHSGRGRGPAGTARRTRSASCTTSSASRSWRRFPPWSSPPTCPTASSRSSSARGSAPCGPTRVLLGWPSDPERGRRVRRHAAHRRRA